MNKVLNQLAKFLVDQLGWKYTVYIKDIVTFLLGGVFFAVISILIWARFLLKLKNVEMKKNFKFIKIDLHGKVYYIANPKKYLDSIETIFFMFFLNKKKPSVVLDCTDGKYNKGKIF